MQSDDSHTKESPPPPVLVDPTGNPDTSKSDAEAHLKHHFDSIQDIADSTTLPSLLPPLSKAFASSDDLDPLLERLRLARAGTIEMTSEDKRTLWNELAAASLARAIVSLWSLSLLNLQVRVQLNILGRHLYLETALFDPAASIHGRQKSKRAGIGSSNQHSSRFPFFPAAKTPVGGAGESSNYPSQSMFPANNHGESSSSSSGTNVVNATKNGALFAPTPKNWKETALLSPASQESFLSFTEYLTKEGHVALLSHASRAAKLALSSISLDAELDALSLNALLSDALDCFVRSAGNHGFVMYLLPSPRVLAESLQVGRPDDRALLHGGEQHLVDIDAVMAMMNEVGCVIDSKKFYDVAMVCAQTIACKFSHNVSDRLGSSQKLPFARIVPLLTMEGKKVLLNASNEWTSAMNELEEVKALCATVYSCGPPL